MENLLLVESFRRKVGRSVLLLIQLQVLLAFFSRAYGGTFPPRSQHVAYSCGIACMSNEM